MEMNFIGIKCDHPSCNFEDDSVKVEDYPKYVNKPCPKCGSNLLTEADFKTVQKMQALANNKIIKSIEAVCRFFGDKEKKVMVEMNGTGKIKFKDPQNQ